ncbi:MAG TPA: ABC transporter permease subunit [Trebonia sp.]|jgi:ABC-type nitrate/sulfonate/bicarbonate transport system permease component|nr:ABC transporter permease subunit [Trebonia sp.]
MAKNLGLLAARGLLYIWLPVALLVGWWYGPSPQSLYFPPLWVIGDAFNREWLGNGGHQLSTDLVPSLWHVAAGYAIAVVAGVAIALLLSSVKVFYDASLPLITFFRGLPSPALIPALLLIFGLGGGFKVAIIAFGSMWPVLLNAYDGFQSINNVQQETARSYHLGTLRQIFLLRLPAASPQIMAGARVALQVAILLMVASEFLAATQGIGYAISVAQVNFDTPGVWSGMLLLGVVGIILNALFVLAERGILYWHSGMTAQQARG